MSIAELKKEADREYDRRCAEAKARGKSYVGPRFFVLNDSSRITERELRALVKATKRRPIAHEPFPDHSGLVVEHEGFYTIEFVGADGYVWIVYCRDNGAVHSMLSRIRELDYRGQFHR